MQSEVYLELYHLGKLASDTVQRCFSGPIFNKNVFTFDITEITESLPKCLDAGIVTADTQRESNPRYFVRLLRFDGNAKR
jgi:hypothetical protein